MKKLIFLFIVFGLLALVYLNRGQIRGLWPALGPAPKRIETFFKPTGSISNKPQTLPAKNETGFPLTLPAGFTISIFAKDLGNPRVLIKDPGGALLTSVPNRGVIYALVDSDSDGNSDQTITVVSGLNRPHGLALREGKLYVAESDGVDSFDYDGGSKKAANKKRIIELPGVGGHFTRTIGFGPDGRLYISVGSSCNVCIEKDWRRAKILVANGDGTGLREFASGLRNSVFFSWHPVTALMWATDMGRDLIGDDIPPDEINIVKEGKFYGWPYCHGKKIHDSTFDRSVRAKQLCESSISSHIDLQAHSAPLGLAFIPQNSNWPEVYHGDLLVAYHGSWNRTVPTGYSVVRIKLDETGNYQGIEDFISGWLEDGSSLGRPVDVLFDDNILYISDDKAGVVYRVIYQ